MMWNMDSLSLKYTIKLYNNTINSIQIRKSYAKVVYYNGCSVILRDKDSLFLLNDKENVEKLYLENGNYKSLSDIYINKQNFPNLKVLDCRNNKLETLRDVDFPKLEILNCSNNNLTDITGINTPNLLYLDCSYNFINELGSRHNLLYLPNLESLNCYGNGISDFNNLYAPKLKTIDCDRTSLNFIDRDKFPVLEHIYDNGLNGIHASESYLYRTKGERGIWNYFNKSLSLMFIYLGCTALIYVKLLGMVLLY